MDVIRASTIGVRNTVALMGTALTKEQINLIKRLSNNIILCLDGDDPGQNAMLKIGDVLLNEGLDVKVIVLPNPDDPDSFIMNNGKADVYAAKNMYNIKICGNNTINLTKYITPLKNWA